MCRDRQQLLGKVLCHAAFSIPKLEAKSLKAGNFMVRPLLSILLVFAIAAGELPVHAVGVSPLGVVTQAAGANINSGGVSAGATVFDGDSFTTTSTGLLRVRAGAAQFYLAGQSNLKLHTAPGGTLAQLSGGTLVFSSARANAMEVEVAQAHIRPASDQPTVAQISVAGPKEIDVRATRGSLQFSYNGESQIIPEGSAYRFVLDPPEDTMFPASASPAFPDQKGPKPPGHPNKKFLYFIIGTAAFISYIAIDEALESPSKP